MSGKSKKTYDNYGSIYLLIYGADNLLIYGADNLLIYGADNLLIDYHLLLG